RVFADAKEKHGMRYTFHRGLARVTNWVKLKFAAMNLKRLALWAFRGPLSSNLHHICRLRFTKRVLSCSRRAPFFDSLKRLDRSRRFFCTFPFLVPLSIDLPPAGIGDVGKPVEIGVDHVPPLLGIH
ncbi:transposase, partial [Candidatus Darwinibacter acetoxidans]